MSFLKNPRKSLVLCAYLAIIFCFIIGVRFFDLQVIRSDHFQEEVTKQRVKEIVQLPERGKIVDRNGSAMALSLMAQDVNVYPNLIKTTNHQEQVAKLLSDTLDMKYEKILKIVQGNDYWASVAKRVDPDKIKIIKESTLGGIEIQQSPKRYYPNGSVGSGLLGFVNHENEPGAGVELSMNQFLAGIPGYTVAETDNQGKVIPVGFENISNPIDGQQVTMTTDNYLQYILEKRLEQAQEEMNPKAIHAVLMNPNTGEIYAMASTPTFDANNYGDYEPQTWTNNAASYVYEPGSTFKPIYMALALEEGHINTKSEWYDGVGSINVNGTWLRNFDSRGLGQMSLETIIVNSSNVGMVEISRSMKNKEIVAALSNKGFGQKTGLEIPGEEPGLFPSAKQLDDDPLMKATMSFGQGLAITPIQLITAFSEVINGGKDINPTLVSKVEDEHGNVLYKTELDTKKQGYKKEISTAMKSYLQANSKVGSGRNYQIDGYQSGTKTGSAWVVENGKYKDGVIIGSFIGFAPYENPEFAMLVVVDQPEGIEFGGPAGGPIWHDVMEEALRYKGIQKDEVGEKVAEEVNIEAPNTTWMLYEDAKRLIESSIKDVKVVKDGKGSVVYAQEYVYKKKRLEVILKTREMKDKNFFYMPNVYGKTTKEIQEIFKNTDINMRFHGEGAVTEVNLEPGRHNHSNNLVFWMKKGK